MRLSLAQRFGSRAGDLDLRNTVLALSRIPYARPSEPTADAVVAEWRGTCTTKHPLLRQLSTERWPGLDLTLWNRVYRVDRELARSRWGEEVAACVPRDGLVDVHSFSTVERNGCRLLIDVTFPVADWDGVSNMDLWCGDGVDHQGGMDLVAYKSRLVNEHCDSAVRERFIATLSMLVVSP